MAFVIPTVVSKAMHLSALAWYLTPPPPACGRLPSSPKGRVEEAAAKPPGEG